jgi:hypothetical protein
MLLRLVLRLARRRIEGTVLGKEMAVTITVTIATKTTMITAAVAVGVLAAAGTATPTGQAPIASAPTKHVSIPAGPSPASPATPNTFFAAVTGLAPGAAQSAVLTAGVGSQPP